MKQFYALLLLITTLASCGPKVTKSEQLIKERIEYVYSLKSLVGKNVWADFDSIQFDVPLVYYTETNCYVANPTSRFLDIYKPTLLSDNGSVRVFKTTLLDSIPFHMAAGIILGDSTADYNYKSPFMNCSSVEITQRFIPSVQSTEEWATMILHEYFHGFQFKHQNYTKYAEEFVFSIPQDSLKQAYRSHQRFKELVDEENDLLLQAIDVDDSSMVDAHIRAFLATRARRRLLCSQLLNFDIKPVEQAYETMEGTARYVEYSLYKEFATEQSDERLARLDTCYHGYQSFRTFQLNENKWLFSSGQENYFYATGFNMLRLFDKLGIQYEQRLFNESGLSLEQLLNDWVK